MRSNTKSMAINGKVIPLPNKLGKVPVKTSFSLGTKLIFSIVGLIMVSGMLLDFSTIFLLRDDKKTYTYQLQSSEAFLVGKNFVNSFKNTVDILKLSLSLVKPNNNTLTEVEKNALQSVLDHQNSVISTRFETFKPLTYEPIAILNQSFKPKKIEELGLDQTDLQIPYDLLKDKMGELIKKGYLILNISKMGSPGLLVVAVTDVNPNSTTNDFIPVAMGFFPLESLGSGIKASRLTVATEAGHILFDTDSPAFYLSKNASDNSLFQIAEKNPTISNGTTEFVSDSREYLGSYYRPGLDLVVLTQTPLMKAMKATYLLTEKCILLGIISIGGAILFGIFFSKSLTAGLAKLYEATKEITKGNFNVKLNVKSGDEIGALANSFNTMSEEIGILIKEQVRKVQLENELALASTVQQTLIPLEDHDTKNLLIHSHYRSASECGGDWWGYFEMGDKTCVIIADATGHGLPSALITAAVRSCFSLIQKMAEENFNIPLSPADMLSYANRVIYDASQGKIMMTCFLGIFDFKTNQFTYANAGHNPQWFYKKDGDTYKRESLSIPSVRLGENKDLNDIKSEVTTFHPDDLLFLYTDGVIEGTNPRGEQFSKKKVGKIVDQQVVNGPKQLINTLMSDFLKHNTESKGLDDDVTLVALKIKQPKGGTNV
jgi:serine phosphatase RsbU (regulator of sigma subunit)